MDVILSIYSPMCMLRLFSSALGIGSTYSYPLMLKMMMMYCICKLS